MLPVRSGGSRWRAGRLSGTRGFSLIELVVATLVFTVIAGAAFSLFLRQEPLYRQDEKLAGLNISLGNAVEQMQLDLANAGTGIFPGANVPNWPIGVTLQNTQPAGGGCYDAATFTYTAACFDTMSVISAQLNVPALHPSVIGTNCVSSTSSILFAQPAPGHTAAQDAAFFQSGDELLLLKSNGSQLTAVVLTSNGSDAGGKIQLQHNPTGANGTNGTDPLGITIHANNKLGTTFCSGDWIIKLDGVTYTVDATDPTNPKLMRRQGQAPADLLADQIIGFKVGAALWNGGASTSTVDYNYDASTYTNAGGPDPYDYTLVRSVRVSLIGRTVPNQDPTFTFRNAFDGGPYQIQGTSVVVNPRNLSMND